MCLAALAVCALLISPAPAGAQEYIEVPERQTYTDVKAGPSSGAIVLVLIPSGTVLPVEGRQGEWIQIRLTPDLRKAGVPMRWYQNEASGFVHESTVHVRTGPLPAKPVSREPPPSQPPREYARVPARQTNADVKGAANSGAIVLVLVPSGTVLPVLGRQGEWIRVALAPDLRKIGTPMRWYKQETEGYVHESTVEIFKR